MFIGYQSRMIYKKTMGKYDKPNILKLQVINSGSCLPIFHLDIWDTQNRWKKTHDRKESVFIVKEVIEKEAIE